MDLQTKSIVAKVGAYATVVWAFGNLLLGRFFLMIAGIALSVFLFRLSGRYKDLSDTER